MPPAAPTGLTLTPKGTGIGAATLGWTHAGTTKYEVLYKRLTDLEWQSLHLADSAQFGTASPWTMEVPLTDSISYTVRAINAAGEASPKATAIDATGTVVGTWFLPFVEGEIVDDDWAWIGGLSPDLIAERDGSLVRVPSRRDKLSVTTGIVHLYEGRADGTILDYAQFSLSGDEWLGRLERLFRNQRKYRWVWMASARHLFKCELTESIEVNHTTAGAGRAYEVSIGVREIPNRYGA